MSTIEFRTLTVIEENHSKKIKGGMLFKYQNPDFLFLEDKERLTTYYYSFVDFRGHQEVVLFLKFSLEDNLFEITDSIMDYKLRSLSLIEFDDEMKKVIEDKIIYISERLSIQFQQHL